MKFFTLDYYHGKDDAYSSVSERYTRHLEAMRGVLPAHVLALAKLLGVDDGLVVQVQYQRDQRLLRLVLRCGHLQMGYYDLILTYEGASLSPQDEWALARVAHKKRGEQQQEFDLAHHEVDKAEGRGGGGIEHRLLFHPGVWFAIRCDRLHWEKVNRPDRRLPDLPDRFPGGPTSAP